MACSSKSVRSIAAERYVARDDPASRDVSHRDLLSIRANNVLENSIAVEEGISEMIADNHTVVANAGELGIAVHHFSIVQGSEGAIAIDESVIRSAAIAGIHVYADNHAIIVEGSRKGLGRAGNIGDRKKGSVTAALKDVLPFRITVSPQKSIQVVYSYKCRAVVGGIGMDDQGCG